MKCTGFSPYVKHKIDRASAAEGMLIDPESISPKGVEENAEVNVDVPSKNGHS